MIDQERLANPKRDLRGAASYGSRRALASLEPWIVPLLACPLDRSAVRLNGNELVCIRCGHRYPVLAGMPNMLPTQVTSEQQF
jgi:uncharacterized protein YbaR (Trm112 family)